MRFFTILFLLGLNLHAEVGAAANYEHLNLEEEIKINQIYAVSPDKRWYIGYKPSGTSRNPTLFLLEAQHDGLKLKYIVNIPLEERYFPHLYEDFSFDANDKLHFSVQIVQKSHQSHTYYFQLIEGQWLLVRDDYSAMDYCGEGDKREYFFSVESVTNLLTGDIQEQRYSPKDCKPLKMVKNKYQFSLISLKEFYPYMEIEPKNNFTE